MTLDFPLYDCTVTGEGEDGVFAVSFVECPAIEVNFVALAKAAERRPVALDKAKHVLTGPLIIPDVPIYRNDRELGEYYVRFRRDEIERIAAKMMRTGCALHTTTHQHEKQLRGNYLTELWTVADPKRDKSVALGLGELPAGTLVVSYKIEDTAYWRDEVLPGKVRGFSLEGLFNFNNVSMAKSTEKKPAEQKKRGKFAAALAAAFGVLLEDDARELADEAQKDETDSGTPYLIFELADGQECWVDAEGYATLDGQQMAAGEHPLADGNVIVIDEEGKLVITQPEGEGEEPERPETELAAKKRAAALLSKRAELAAKKKERDEKIAALEARLAALEKQPSASVQRQRVDEAPAGPMTHEQRLAQITRNRLERANAKK